MDVAGGAGRNCDEVTQPYIDRMAVGEVEQELKPEYGEPGDDVELVRVGSS